MKRLKDIDNKIFQLRKKISLILLGPVNLQAEKEKFFKNLGYNPQFIYPENDIDFRECYDTINSFKFDEGVMDDIFKAKAKGLKRLFHLYQNIGKKDFVKSSIIFYGRPDKFLLKKAKKIALSYKPRICHPKQVQHSEDGAKILRKVLKRLGFNWIVKTEHMVANAFVNPLHKTLSIKRDAMFTHTQIMSFVAHEIYGHVLRSECGASQPYKIFYSGLPRYESTEEGLALYNELLVGTLDKRRMKGYAVRVIAIDKALKSSFYETYRSLCRYYSKEKAFAVSVRVKRGLKDTSRPGAFTKDLLYLKGFLEIKEFVKDGGKIEDLYIGKIAVQHIKQLKKMDGIKDTSKILKKVYKGNRYSVVF